MLPRPKVTAKRTVTIHRRVATGVRPELIERWVRSAWKRLRHPAGAVAIAFVGPAESQRLNRRYRRKNRPTNVLSFTYARQAPEYELGEIVLCPDVIRREAALQRRPYRTYLKFLIDHGMIHLLGFDHATSREQAEWERLAQQLQ